MAKKVNQGLGGLVYSTNKEYIDQLAENVEEIITPLKESQKLRVKLDTKQRAGKVVTLVEGFVGKEEDMDVLAKQLKTKCGAGGSNKDGFIIIQGDYKDKVITWLKEWGYNQTK